MSTFEKIETIIYCAVMIMGALLCILGYGTRKESLMLIGVMIIFVSMIVKNIIEIRRGE